MARSSFNADLPALEQHVARLISAPRSKPERVATSALLAVVGSVDEFGGRFMRRVGGPRYQNLRRYYKAFSEVPIDVLLRACGAEKNPLDKSDAAWGSHVRPDGVVVVSRNKEWRALVEVKCGADRLDESQVVAYHEIARHLQFDALITISNEAGGRDNSPPTKIRRALRPANLRKVPVTHLQWRGLLGDAIALFRKDLEDNVADEDQDWILGEWLAYMHDSKSEVLIPACLSDGWIETLKLAKQRLLQPDSKHLQAVAAAWGDLAREIEFQMRIKGIELEPKISRKEREDASLRRQGLIDEAIASRTLTLGWKCPEPVRSFYCSVDLDARVVRYYFEVDSFSGKSAGARVMSWGAQIADENVDGVIIRPKWRKPSVETPLLLSECKGVRELNAFLKSKSVDPVDGSPVRMRVEWHRSLEGRAGRQGRTHLDQICEGVHDFYSRVMAGLRSVEVMPTESRSRRSEADEAIASRVMDTAKEAPGHDGEPSLKTEARLSNTGVD